MTEFFSQKIIIFYYKSLLLDFLLLAISNFEDLLTFAKKQRFYRTFSKQKNMTIFFTLKIVELY